MTDIANQGGQPAQPTVDIRAAEQAPAPQTAVPVTTDGTTPAPVAPVQEAPKPEAPKTPVTIGEVEGDGNPPLDADQNGDVVEYVPTGDAGMDMALSFVGKLGFRPDHPAMLKAGEGDFTFIKAALAGLGAKAVGWEQYVALAEQSFTKASEAAEKEGAKVRATIYSTAGGEAAWGQIAEWAAANASAEEKAEINRMLGGSAFEARAAVIMLKQQYEASSGTTIEPANPIAGGVPGAGADAPSVGPLSPSAYATEVANLMRTKGPQAVNGNSPEYRALQQRALAYRG